MGLFDNIKNTDVKIEDAKDVLGGGGPLDTDVYDFTIKLAYVDFSKGGAMSVNLDLESDGGHKLRSTLWITSGDAKGNKNYYVDRSGKNQFLPGYIVANDIATLITDKSVEDLDHEEKVIAIYDFSQRTEVPQQREVFTELMGEKITLAVEKQVVDKNVLNDQTNKYEPSGETREQNELIKAFHSEYGVTVGEAKMGVKEPDFRDRWAEKYKGQVRDKTSKKATGNAAGTAAGAPPAAKPTTSLFA